MRTVIIADDLTGANVSGYLYKQLGFRVLTKLVLESQHDSDYTAVSYSTDSRAFSSEDAYEKVAEAVNKLVVEGDTLISKRIDSTLRGNLGSELDAVMDTTGIKHAVVCPAYPDSHRVCSEGVVYLYGEMLHTTSVANDPKVKVTTSNVYEIFTSQTSKKVTNIYMSMYDNDKSKLTGLIKKAFAESEVLIVDAKSNEDIDLIGAVCAELDEQLITVDPGPFSANYAKHKLGNNKVNIDSNSPSSIKETSEKVLYVVGSVTDVSERQLKYISEDAFMISVDARKLLDDSKLGSLIDKVIRQVGEKMKTQDIVGITTIDLEKDYRLDLPSVSKKLGIDVDEITKIINSRLALIVKGVLEGNNYCHSLFSSGGDVTVEVCKALHSSGLEIIDEVIPLAVAGKMTGKDCGVINIVTKGGLIGDETGIKVCLDYLRYGGRNE